MDHCYGDVQPGCEVFNCHYKVRDVGEAQLAQERKNYNKVDMETTTDEIYCIHSQTS